MSAAEGGGSHHGQYQQQGGASHRAASNANSITAAAAAAAAAAALPGLSLAQAFLPGLLGGDPGTTASMSAAAAAASGGVTARRKVWATRFIPEGLYEHYAKQAAVTMKSLPAGSTRIREVPQEFVSILPLDKGSMQGQEEGSMSVTGSYGYPTSVFKGISSLDGFPYAVRRVEARRVPQHILDGVVQQWQKAAHPSIVSLRKAIQGSGFSSTIFFVHDYYPGAITVSEAFLTPGTAGSSSSAPIPEATLWSFICQMVSGLRVVHEAGLSFRGVLANHVLLTGHNRLRLSGAGILDVLEADTQQTLAEMQRLDILGLGLLLVQLATRQADARRSMEASLSYVGGSYSRDLHALLVLLNAKPVTIHELIRILAPKLVAELDCAYDHSDAMDAALAREMDNGRLLRLLMKLGFINERPSQSGDPLWSETGDRYQLKLYRNFLFHQISQEGRPVLDVAHVVDSLNRLDVGTGDRVLLSKEDGTGMLVSSYSQLKKCLTVSFEELRLSAKGGAAGAAAGAAAAGAGLGSSARGEGIPQAVLDARVQASNARMNLLSRPGGRGGVATVGGNALAMAGGMGAMGAMGMGMGMGMPVLPMGMGMGMPAAVAGHAGMPVGMGGMDMAAMAGMTGAMAAMGMGLSPSHQQQMQGQQLQGQGQTQDLSGGGAGGAAGQEGQQGYASFSGYEQGQSTAEDGSDGGAGAGAGGGGGADGWNQGEQQYYSSNDSGSGGDGSAAGASTGSSFSMLAAAAARAVSADDFPEFVPSYGGQASSSAAAAGAGDSAGGPAAAGYYGEADGSGYYWQQPSYDGGSGGAAGLAAGSGAVPSSAGAAAGRNSFLQSARLALQASASVPSWNPAEGGAEEGGRPEDGHSSSNSSSAGRFSALQGDAPAWSPPSKQAGTANRFSAAADASAGLAAMSASATEFKPSWMK